MASRRVAPGFAPRRGRERWRRGRGRHRACPASPQEQSRAAIRRRIDQSDPRANVFHSVLVIDRVQSQDRGLYTCHVASGPTARAVNASVHVYGKRPRPAPSSRGVGGSAKPGRALSAGPPHSPSGSRPHVRPLNLTPSNWRERVALRNSVRSHRDPHEISTYVPYKDNGKTIVFTFIFWGHFLRYYSELEK